MQWNNIENFIRLVYTKNLTVTAQQVLDHYIQILVDIIATENLNSKIIQYTHNFRKRIIVWYHVVYYAYNSNFLV